MPDFANPFAGMTPERKMTLAELTRALRLDIAAELEAIHLYEAQADATDDPLAAKVLRDVANEERVHVGEFQKVLNILLADEVGFLEEGAQEVAEMQAELTGTAPAEPAGEPSAPPAESRPAAPSVPTVGSLR